LALSARHCSDATRSFRDGLLTALLPEPASAVQRPDGTLRLRARTEEGLEQLRFVLAVDDDHSEFLRRFGRDPLLGTTLSRLAGMRQLRLATVTHALLRALCGQLIESGRARAIERRIVRAATPRDPETGLHEPPTRASLGCLSPAAVRAHGLADRRASALVRVSWGLDVERLHSVPTAIAAARIERERALGPWSAGVICLEGLGRTERGLVGDLGLVKVLAAQRGRWVEGWETAELLEPYGEWAGLASVYLLAGFGRGLLPLPARRAA
ncbi:MAG: DNA-3-methyladenine glycosylase family protein, partial [Gaiellaceae bacterium]